MTILFFVQGGLGAIWCTEQAKLLRQLVFRAEIQGNWSWGESGSLIGSLIIISSAVARGRTMPRTIVDTQSVEVIRIYTVEYVCTSF